MDRDGIHISPNGMGCWGIVAMSYLEGDEGMW